MTQEDFILEIKKLFQAIPRSKREVHKNILVPEICKIYRRIEELESIVRQIRGTMDIFLEHQKINFNTERDRFVFMELVHKWDEELSPIRGTKREVA